MKSHLVSVEGKFLLPSSGVFSPSIPKEVMLRAMNTMNEKQRQSDNNMDRVPRLIQECITEPQGFEVDNLPMFDIFYLMYQLRVITFGPKYDISCNCSSCGKVFEKSVDLTSLEVNFLPDDFENKFELPPLPVSGDVLQCVINTLAEQRAMQSEAKKLQVKSPDDGDTEFILKRALKIIKKNGKDLRGPERTSYVGEMHAADLNAFDQWYAELTGEFGLDNTTPLMCPHCGQEDVYFLPMNNSFFRPKVQSIRRADKHGSEVSKDNRGAGKNS